MIIFLYITRLASNNLMINLHTTHSFFLLLTFRTIIIYISHSTKHVIINQENFNVSNIIFKIYSSLNQYILIIIIIYLLLVLLICVNIILTNRGPLRALKSNIKFHP